LTLALLGEEAQASRVIIRAVYLPDSELAGGDVAPAQTVAVDQAVTLDGSLRLTFLGSMPFVPPGAPPGYACLVVDYAVENTLDDQAILTINFMSQVVDSGGLAYPSSVAVRSEAVRYPPLPAHLAAGQVATTTAVYAVPEMALRAGLAWRFAPSPSGTTVQAQIAPYSGPLQPQIAIRQAVKLPDGSVAATLSLGAPGLREVQVTAADVQVQGGTLGSNNAFPWHVAAGASADFTLSLLPDGRVVTLALLGQGFELTVE
jgi:hypothetical protein